jgi:hypothetical protein
MDKRLKSHYKRTLLVLVILFICSCVLAVQNQWYSIYFFMVTLFCTMHACYSCGQTTSTIKDTIELEEFRNSLRVEYDSIKKEVTKIKSRGDGIGSKGDRG